MTLDLLGHTVRGLTILRKADEHEDKSKRSKLDIFAKLGGGLAGVAALISLILYLFPYPPPETRNRTFDFYARNDHCKDPRDISWTVAAEAGWKIIPESVKGNHTAKSKKSSYNGIKHISSSGFTITGRIVNHGNCILGIGRDGRGDLGVRGTYQEEKL